MTFNRTTLTHWTCDLFAIAECCYLDHDPLTFNLLLYTSFICFSASCLPFSISQLQIANFKLFNNNWQWSFFRCRRHTIVIAIHFSLFSCRLTLVICMFYLSSSIIYKKRTDFCEKFNNFLPFLCHCYFNCCCCRLENLRQFENCHWNIMRHCATQFALKAMKEPFFFRWCCFQNL